MAKIILFIASSEDGFIADSIGAVDWLPQPKNEEDLVTVGYKKLMVSVDTIIMGRASFEQIKTFGPWAWQDKHTYVFTSKTIKGLPSHIISTCETPSEFTKKIKLDKKFGDIWLLGGAKLAQSFARDKLIDEIILTIIPQKLGEGIALAIDLSKFIRE